MRTSSTSVATIPTNSTLSDSADRSPVYAFTHLCADASKGARAVLRYPILLFIFQFPALIFVPMHIRPLASSPTVSACTLFRHVLSHWVVVVMAEHCGLHGNNGHRTTCTNWRACWRERRESTNGGERMALFVAVHKHRAIRSQTMPRYK